MIKTVLGLGTATMDIVLQCAGLPKADGFEVIKKEQLYSGGSCANMLVTLAKLGVNARQIAKIGDDSLGKTFREDLIKDGVDDSLLMTVPDGETMHTFVIVAENGDHTIFTNMGDCIMNLGAEEITPAMLDGVDLFYTDIFPARPAIALAELCAARNIPVVFCLQCPVDFMNQIGVSNEEITAMLALSDLFLSGREGYYSLTNVADYEEAMRILYEKYPMEMGVICTAGDRGALWLSKDEKIVAKPYEIVPVDTTGAGDCFTGGLIYSYFVRGQPKQQAMDFAAAAAAIKCTQSGPRIQADARMVHEFMAR
ncbi:MAG: carbohydrate kinase family protein [Syntrophomonadaceae bacterium]|jgi:sugar/nucleoside kinase (ribokinase family)|nr:carbohydrate kinase family protein [Syntrophomonadaceae bacterium]